MSVEDPKVKNIIDRAISNLFEEIKHGRSKRLAEYLKFISNFYQYSLNNTILIYAQMKGATHVAGFDKWKAMRYKIKKGSRAIKILAPQKYIFMVVDGKKVFYRQMTKEQKEKTSEHISGLNFYPAAVFDISQCENRGKRCEKYYISLGDSHKSKYLSLKRIIEKSGIKVRECDTGAAEGISFGGLIHVKKENDYNNKLLTLIHEYAHEILHKGSENKSLSRGFKECQAEATSFVVGKYLGIDNPFSSDYILNWGGTKDKLKENLTSVLAATGSIIKNIEREKSKEKIRDVLKESTKITAGRDIKKYAGMDR